MWRLLIVLTPLLPLLLMNGCSRHSVALRDSALTEPMKIREFPTPSTHRECLIYVVDMASEMKRGNDRFRALRGD